MWAGVPERHSVAGTAEEQHRRLARALQRATRGIEDLLRYLPPAEAELFVPEVAILAELGPLLRGWVDGGAAAEEAVNEATSQVSTDLLLDARARLLDGLGHDQLSVESLLEGRDGDYVLVAKGITPSVVALLPAQVVGIVVASDGTEQSGGEYTSHAVILARGRGIPLAFLPSDVVLAIAIDDPVVLDTIGSVALVWVAPDESIVADARRRQEGVDPRDAPKKRRRSPLRLRISGSRCMSTSVPSTSDSPRRPRESDCCGRSSCSPVIRGRRARWSSLPHSARLRPPSGGRLVVVRLFDAGGDKPLAWLQAPAGSPHARGVELLFMHPGTLETQLRAIVRAAEHVRVRVLLPLVTSAGDVERIRSLSQGKLDVGAMIETPAAVDQIDEFAAVADFISIGTNDLFAMVSGRDRADSTLSFDTRTLGMIERTVEGAHARARKVSVCGEMAGDPRGARILVGLGVDVLSVRHGALRQGEAFAPRRHNRRLPQRCARGAEAY